MNSISCKSHYTIALAKGPEDKTSQMYSWGIGSSYVLGNREEENQFTPYKVHPKMFEEFPIHQAQAGTLHACVLAGESVDALELPVFDDSVTKFQLPPDRPKEEIRKEILEDRKKLKHELSKVKKQDKLERDVVLQ